MSIWNSSYGYYGYETQNTLVEQIEKERAAVDACKTLITLFEAKIKTKIAGFGERRKPWVWTPDADAGVQTHGLNFTLSSYKNRATKS